jgi:hypothetical protein
VPHLLLPAQATLRGMLSTKLLLLARMPKFMSASAAVCASSHLKASWLNLEERKGWGWGAVQQGAAATQQV